MLNNLSQISKILFSEKSLQQISFALPNGKKGSAERHVRAFLSAIQRNSKLLECTQLSILGACVQSAQLGLSPDPNLGHVYIMPKKSKARDNSVVYYATVLIGYKGFIHLAFRTNKVSSIYADVVMSGDHFEEVKGLHRNIIHQPGENRDMTKNPTHVYAVIHYTNGGFDFAVLSKQEVELIKGSGSQTDMIWDSHYHEMAKKTAIRRMLKTQPLSPEVQSAVALDELGDSGLNQQVHSALDYDLLPEELRDDYTSEMQQSESDNLATNKSNAAKAKQQKNTGKAQSTVESLKQEVSQ